MPIDPQICKTTNTANKASWSHWPLNLQIHKHNELCPLTLKSVNPQAQRAKRAVPIDPWMCKTISPASEASRAHWTSKLRIYKQSELSTLTLKSSNVQAVPIDPRICKFTGTAGEASCAHRPSNMQTHKHRERSKLCPLTLESANPQSQRAVPIDPRTYKSIDTAS